MPIDPQIQASLRNKLQRELFTDQNLFAYAVLDGASNPALLDYLYADPSPEFECLYRGELEPDIAECAPYLAHLEPGTPFTDWVTSKGWGEHWGIFAVADCDLRTLRHHFRKLNMIYDAENHRPLLFRYYDPRVLNIFLPTCDAQQIGEFFGPVRTFFAESEDGTSLNRFFTDGQTVLATQI